MQRSFFHNKFSKESIDVLSTLDSTVKIYDVFGEDKDKIPSNITISHAPYLIDKQFILEAQDIYTTGLITLNIKCCDYLGDISTNENKPFTVLINNISSTYESINGILQIELNEPHPTTVNIRIEADEYMPFEVNIVVEKSLEDAKLDKINELNNTCNEVIRGRFESQVDGIIYHFSNDEEAQTNFSKVKDAFKDGYITSINWTAYDVDNNVIRISLDWVKFEPVYVDHLNHIQSNISKFRDLLQPMVENTQSMEEIKKISWENA